MQDHGTSSQEPGAERGGLTLRSPWREGEEARLRGSPSPSLPQAAFRLSG